MRPLKTGEVGQLLERGEVLLVARGDQHLVELEHEVLHRDLAGLAEAEQVLERLQRALEQIGVLDDAAVGGHQRAVRLEEHQFCSAAGRFAWRPVRRDLVVGRVHAELRLHRHRAHL